MSPVPRVSFVSLALATSTLTYICDVAGDTFMWVVALSFLRRTSDCRNKRHEDLFQPLRVKIQLLRVQTDGE